MVEKYPRRAGDLPPLTDKASVDTIMGAEAAFLAEAARE